MHICAIGDLIDSGPTGGGILIDGHDCSGHYATYEATAETGREVCVTVEHLWSETGQFIRERATACERATVGDTDEATGSAIDRLLETLRLEYEAL